MEHLQKRGIRFYIRLAIPQDVRCWFEGRRELRRSLNTACYTEAKTLCRSEVFRAVQLFVQLRGGYMTSEEMRTLVANSFERSLQEAEESRAEGVGVLGEDNDEDGSNDALDGLDRHLSDLVEDLARGKHESAARVADAILEGAGVTLDKGSHEYRMICREALKGVISADPPPVIGPPVSYCKNTLTCPPQSLGEGVER